MSGRASGPIVLELQPLADRVLVERVGVLHHVVACVVGAAIRRLRERFRRANRDVERFLSRSVTRPDDHPSEQRELGGTAWKGCRVWLKGQCADLPQLAYDAAALPGLPRKRKCDQADEAHCRSGYRTTSRRAQARESSSHTRYSPGSAISGTTAGMLARGWTAPRVMTPSSPCSSLHRGPVPSA